MELKRSLELAEDPSEAEPNPFNEAEAGSVAATAQRDELGRRGFDVDQIDHRDWVGVLRDGLMPIRDARTGVIVGDRWPAPRLWQEQEAPGAEAPFTLVPVDWPPLLAAGVPKLEYVAHPYLPARKRVWGVGAAEAGKSIWAAYQTACLTRSGLLVVYVSQENGLEEEARRFIRLRPAFECLRLYVDQDLDLVSASHAGALIEACQGAALCVVDTLTACWSGDEDSNAAIAELDRNVLVPLVRETGATALVLDHTGNPQPFVRRRGVSAPRGASAKGQKADHLLEFRAGEQSEFTIDHGKARGAQKEPVRRFRVIDTEDEGLDLEEVETTDDEKVAELADKLVALIVAAGAIEGTGTLKDLAKKDKVGNDLAAAAVKLLKKENPPRVVVKKETIETGGGRQQAEVWRPAPRQLDDEAAELFP